MQDSDLKYDQLWHAHDAKQKYAALKLHEISTKLINNGEFTRKQFHLNTDNKTDLISNNQTLSVWFFSSAVKTKHNVMDTITKNEVVQNIKVKHVVKVI